MHANVVQANIHDLDEAKRGLEELLPTLRSAAGFVAAYFVALDNSHGVSLVIFETEEQARNAAPPAGTEAPGVTLDTIRFGEVIATG
jgi:hypothetical protein